MWNNVSTWLTSRRAGTGGAGTSIVSRLIGGVRLHWEESVKKMVNEPQNGDK